MKILKWFLLLVTLPFFVACFEDKSTPADKPLSNIKIEQGIDSVYNIYKFDTLVIKPVISQENIEKLLSYTWEVDLKPYSHDEVFEFVGNELGKFNCRLIVENEDGKAFFPFVLYVNSDYEYGITVLSQDENGNSMLSFMQEPMTEGDTAKFTAYDCFARNNPDEAFAAGAIDAVQCGGRLIIACQGGGERDDAPTIYYLNEKTMVVENKFTVSEYDDFKPVILGVPTISPIGSIYPIVCENGKVYDFSVTEGVVSEPLKHKQTYAQKCLVDSYSGYYDFLLFDNDNNGMSLISNGYGPFYCGVPYQMVLGDSLYTTKNHFAGRDLVTMVKIRMTTAQRNIAGSQEVLVITKKAGTTGAGIRSEVLYFDFWGYDFTKQEPYFFNSNQQLVASLEKNPITISTPCIANKSHYTLFFAYGNKVYSWNYTSPLSEISSKPLFAVNGRRAQITGFEMSEDHKVTYVSFYDPQKQGLNGSVWLFDTDTGEVLEKHDNFCYRPVKMFYKTR